LGGFSIGTRYIVGNDLPYDCQSDPRFAVACDLDGDGLLEIVTAGFCNQISVLHNIDRRTPGMAVCTGDGSTGFCPCANPGATGHGCENSSFTGGARLDGSGSASLSSDTLSLTSSGEPASTLSIFLQGSKFVPRIPLGQGLDCAGGVVSRLLVRRSVNGVATAPGSQGPSLSSRSAQLGDPLSAGSIRVYQVFYRDAAYSTCRSSFNLSSAQQIVWTR
jgi:hypothetical protein